MTVVGGASTIRQCIEAVLADEVQIDLRSLLLGDGLRLFDRLGGSPIDLESLGVSESAGVTHWRYRVKKGGTSEV